MMILHHSPTSPYVRKVMVLLHETGQLDSVSLVQTSGTPIAPGAVKNQNPLSKVPALERPDGATLFDSRVITQFLASLTDNTLYPEGPRRWETLTLETMGDGILDAALLMRYEVLLRPADKQFDAWIEGQWAKIERSLDALEQRWMAHLAGPLDMGQISIGCALGYLDFRLDERGWRKGHPQLAAWYERFSQRPSMQATVPPAG